VKELETVPPEGQALGVRESFHRATSCAKSSCAILCFPMFRANAIYEGEYLSALPSRGADRQSASSDRRKRLACDAIIAHGARPKGQRTRCVSTLGASRCGRKWQINWPAVGAEWD